MGQPKVSTHSIRYRILKDSLPGTTLSYTNLFQPIRSDTGYWKKDEIFQPILTHTVSTHSIRYRILKEGKESSLIQSSHRFNPFDPIQDTERIWSNKSSTHRHWFQPIRSDTGYWKQGGQARWVYVYRVSTHSIRYRILKAVMQHHDAALGQVSTHSIRYRILKVRRTMQPAIWLVSFNPFDPIQDTERSFPQSLRWV